METRTILEQLKNYCTKFIEKFKQIDDTKSKKVGRLKFEGNWCCCCALWILFWPFALIYMLFTTSFVKDKDGNE